MRPIRLFIASYRHDNAEWNITFHANDWDDAKAQARRIGVTLNGEVHGVLPWWAPVPMWTRIANLFRGARQ